MILYESNYAYFFNIIIFIVFEVNIQFYAINNLNLSFLCTLYKHDRFVHDKNIQ